MQHNGYRMRVFGCGAGCGDFVQVVAEQADKVVHNGRSLAVTHGSIGAGALAGVDQRLSIKAEIVVELCFSVKNRGRLRSRSLTSALADCASWQ